MEELFKEIENKKELFTEISLYTGRTFGTIKNHWFNPVDVPEKYTKVVSEILIRRITFQKEVKQLHKVYFSKLNEYLKSQQPKTD